MKKVYFLLIGFTFLFSCKKDKSVPDPVPVTQEENYVFPLKIGNTWEYVNRTVFTLEEDGVRPERDSIYEDFSIWQITGMKVIGGENAFVLNFKTLNNKGVELYQGETYCINKEDGFYLLGFKDSNSSINLREEETNYKYLFKPFALRVDESSESMTHKPIIILKYPIGIGEEWHIRDSLSQDPFLRKNEEFTNINTIFGDVKTLKVSNGPDFFKTYSYFYSKGLMRYTYSSDSVVTDEFKIKKYVYASDLKKCNF